MTKAKNDDWIYDWNFIEDRIPPEAGDYLVAIKIWNARKAYKGKTNHVFINFFDKELNRFDFDRTMLERESKERIYAWKAIEAPPLPRL